MLYRLFVLITVIAIPAIPVSIVAAFYTGDWRYIGFAALGSLWVGALVI